MEEPKITTVEQKTKNPGRVASGKRLAAISREAKARKAEERKKLEEECIENSNILYVSVGTLGVAGLGCGAYRFFCRDEEKPQEKQQEQPQQEKQPEKK